ASCEAYASDLGGVSWKDAGQAVAKAWRLGAGWTERRLAAADRQLLAPEGEQNWDRKARPRPTESTPISMSEIFPATVIPSTGRPSFPFSIQFPSTCCRSEE